MSANPSAILHEKVSQDSGERLRVIALANSPAGRKLRVKLAAAYRILARAGMDDALAGHISLRVPVAPDYFWVNPFGQVSSAR